jgi:integrase
MFEARVTMPGQYAETGSPKRKSFYAKNKAAADRKAREFLQYIEKGGLLIDGRSMTVQEWFEYWLKAFVEPPNKEPKTYQSYEAYVRLYIVPTLGKVRLKDLTTTQVKGLLNGAMKKGLGPCSIRNLRATLRAGLQQAFLEERIAQNVAARVKAPKIEAKDPVHLEAEHVARFLMSVRNHNLGPLFTFALNTGVRVGEATGLRWNDVDLDKQTASIRVQLQRIGGKLQHKSLKSQSARRTIPLLPEAIEALRSAKATQLIAGFQNPMKLVFLNPEGRPLDPKYVDKKLKSALAEAGLPAVSFHKLRHTAATHILAASGSLHATQKILGHSQVSLTANLYGHADEEANRRALEKLAERYRFIS